MKFSFLLKHQHKDIDMKHCSSRGKFNKNEAKREFQRLNRTELEGRLGLSSHKVNEKMKKIIIKMKMKIIKKIS